MKKFASPFFFVCALMFAFLPATVAAQSAYEKFIRDLNADYDEAQLKLKIASWAAEELQAKGYDVVIDVLGTAIKKFPGFVPYHLFRGIAHLEKGSLDSALADFSKMIEIAPANSDGFIMRGNVLVKKAQYDSAIADFTKSISLKPADLKAAHARRADAYIRKGDHLGAVDDWAAAYKLSSLGYGIHETHISEHTKKREFAAAIAEMDKLLRLLPDKRVLFVDRGNIHLENANVDAAIADYTTSINLDPAKESGYVLRARAYLQKKDAASALTDYSKAIQADPKSVSTYSERAQLQQSLGNYDAAIADYTSVIDAVTSRSPKLAASPGMAAYYVERAIAHLGTRNNEKAMADLNKAIQLNAKSGKAFWVRSTIYCGTNRIELAKQDEAEAAALGGKVNKPCTAVAPATAKQVEPVPSVVKKPEVRPSAPETAKSWYDKGSRHMDDRDLEDAIAAFTKAIALRPNFGDAYYQRASALMVTGQHDKAFADFAKAISINPANPLYYEGRAGLYCYRATAVEPADRAGVLKAKQDERKAISLGGDVANPCEAK